MLLHSATLSRQPKSTSRRGCGALALDRGLKLGGLVQTRCSMKTQLNKVARLSPSSAGNALFQLTNPAISW